MGRASRKKKTTTREDRTWDRQLERAAAEIDFRTLDYPGNPRHLVVDDEDMATQLEALSGEPRTPEQDREARGRLVELGVFAEYTDAQGRLCIDLLGGSSFPGRR